MPKGSRKGCSIGFFRPGEGAYSIRNPQSHWGLAVGDIDAEPAPYACTHMLRTDLLPASGDYEDAHASLGRDDLLARDDEGRPGLAAAWGWMLTATR